MKIAYLGSGAWGVCLQRLLANKGYSITCWSIDTAMVERLTATREHPALPGKKIEGDVTFTTDLKQALDGADIIVEAVTAAGVRSTFEKVAALGLPKKVPIVFTSKGIEQKSGLILSQIAVELLGEEYRPYIATLSGPSFADEVSRELPTAVVVASYSEETALQVVNIFTTPFLRLYTSQDVMGTAFGGALKNIIAIACGMAEGLGLGNGAKAALMTRGLREIVRLATACGCKQETLYGLSGMGDLFLTCSSTLSRNFRFGLFLAEGLSPEEAMKKIGAVVEGAYSAITANELSQKLDIPMPITTAVVNILEGKITPKECVNYLMQRAIKAESV